MRDIMIITKKVFNEALTSKDSLAKPKVVYDLYRDLSNVVSSVDVVAEHYLALDLTEDYLQNSSFGDPVDKWRYFLNADLEHLNSAVKKYLHTLSNIGFEYHSFGGILSKYYSCTGYYGFVRDEYNVGFIDPCSSMLHITGLDPNLSDLNSIDIGKYSKIDLTTFESKKELQEQLKNINKSLYNELLKLKEYIQNHYTLNDLL